MTQRKKRQPAAKDKNDMKEGYAKVALSPSVHAGAVVGQYGSMLFGKDNMDVNCLDKVLKESTEAIHHGDMKAVEAMLYGQAVALQTMFTNLARRADCQQGRLDNIEALLKLAFKAQNQCRMTLETLSNVKNPPVVYARQANITSGPQQVNNGLTHATEKNIVQNELLEDSHVKRLDGRTQGQTGRLDTHMETVEVSRRENP